MVRCAMCTREATIDHYIGELQTIYVCNFCKTHLLNIGDLQKKTRDILTELINTLNEHYIKIPLVQAPTKKFENNGRRWGLKIAIKEIEDELEGLIRE